jgi:hypothetical protein
MIGKLDSDERQMESCRVQEKQLKLNTKHNGMRRLYWISKNFQASETSLKMKCSNRVSCYPETFGRRVFLPAKANSVDKRSP